MSHDPRFVVLGEVARFHRGHYRRPAEGPFAEPEGEDACRVVSQRAVRQFHFEGPGAWASYAEIARAFASARSAGTRSRSTPYRREIVFAPLKLVLAERDRPIRAVLTQEPVYPTRGKLVTLRAGQPAEAAYVALGLLNSTLGQGFYRQALRETVGIETSPYGLAGAALAAMPFAARGVELGAAALWSRRAAILCEAIGAGAVEAARHLRPVRQQIHRELCTVLGLSLLEERLLVTLAGRELADRPSSDVQPALPGMNGPDEEPPPRVELLTDAAKAQLERAEAALLTGDVLPCPLEELVRLRRLERLAEEYASEEFVTPEAV